MIVEDRQRERGRTRVKEAGKGRETDEQMKRKGRGTKERRGLTGVDIYESGDALMLL